MLNNLIWSDTVRLIRFFLCLLVHLSSMHFFFKKMYIFFLNFICDCHQILRYSNRSFDKFRLYSINHQPLADIMIIIIYNSFVVFFIYLSFIVFVFFTRGYTVTERNICERRQNLEMFYKIHYHSAVSLA